MSWVKPFPDKALTGHFGKIRTFKGAPSNPHRGTDWAPAGSNKGKTSIPAIANGTVRLVQWSNILGWVVVQSAMANKKVWFIGYCHLACSKHGVNCKGPAQKCTTPFAIEVGQKVTAGKPFGMVMGTSGGASSGVHLHATLSDSLKGVFSGNVYDLHKMIESLAKPAAAKEKPTTTESHQCKCEHCGKVI
jgi:murein DD-endopeptidase MepM/ murein hydrolase activator NlpD